MTNELQKPSRTTASDNAGWFRRLVRRHGLIRVIIALVFWWDRALNRTIPHIDIPKQNLRLLLRSKKERQRIEKLQQQKREQKQKETPPKPKSIVCVITFLPQ